MQRKSRFVDRKKPLREKLLRPFAEFAKTEASSGIVLMIAAVVALVWANSPWAESYFHIWESQVMVVFGPLKLDKHLIHWINDGLMAVFFFLVGLEIKREILLGELASIRKATLPIVAAIGGMVVPALIYAAINHGHPTAKGWGIPMATDIAFALGVLNLLGPRVPFALKVFLAAVAIVDDIGAVAVIAVFYSEEIQWAMLGAAGAILVVMVAINRLGIRGPIYYLIPGVLVWYFFLKSGIHATIAGVLTAMLIPTRLHLAPNEFASEAREALEEFDKHCSSAERSIMNQDQQTAVHALEKACERVQMPLQRIEHMLHPWVSLLIMPIFAFANAGVVLSGGVAGLVTEPASLGVVLGLFIGKPVGVVLASYLAVKAKVASLPDRVGWRQMIGVGILAGIGFTMSLFIADLAFTDATHLMHAKLAILSGSILAGTAGFLLLWRHGRSRRAVGTT